MAISKVTLNGTTLIDATTATAAAGDVIAPKTAMLKNGVVTPGTGTAPAGTKSISITENGTTTEDVTNYASAEITVNVQGSGGGGSGYTLLASGSYTYTGSAAAEIHFPVSYSGTAIYAFAVADEIIAGTNQSYCFVAFLAGGLPFMQYLGGQSGITSIVNTSGVISSQVLNGNNRISNGNLYLNRANNSYLIQPNTYNWFIYGEAAT